MLGCPSSILRAASEGISDELGKCLAQEMKVRCWRTADDLPPQAGVAHFVREKASSRLTNQSGLRSRHHRLQVASSSAFIQGAM